MAILAAVVSSLCMAGVVLLDRIMTLRQGDRESCWTSPTQPLFVSCMLDPLLAAPLLLFVQWRACPMVAAGMAFVAGIILAISNASYFTILFGPAGESTEVAVFSAVIPAVVAAFSAGLSNIGVGNDFLRWHQWCGIVLAVGAMSLFHLFGGRFEFADLKHRALLFVFVVTMAIYMLVIDQAMTIVREHAKRSGIQTTAPEEFVAVYLYFWAGLFCGVSCGLFKKARSDFLNHLPVILTYWKEILLAEVIAMLAFNFEIFGFSNGSVSVVALVASTFTLFVFGGGILLRRVFGFSELAFPRVSDPVRKVILILCLGIGVGLASVVV